MRRARRFAGLVLANAVLGLLLSACASPEAASELAPTLSLKIIGGNRIAFQNGIPVPTFSYQPRRRLDLGGLWRLQSTPMNHDLSLAARPQSLKAILADAAGRESTAFDDTRWPTVEVP
ncbi:MAG: hypothetical protein E6J16_03810, partial [Chloroflexota bacterium]